MDLGVIEPMCLDFFQAGRCRVHAQCVMVTERVPTNNNLSSLAQTQHTDEPYVGPRLLAAKKRVAILGVARRLELSASEKSPALEPSGAAGKGLRSFLAERRADG